MSPSISRSKLSLSFVVVLVVGSADGRVQSTPPRYTAEFLGDALGAAAMNASAQMVGTVSSPATRGFVAGPGMPLMLLPLPPGRTSSWANDINDAGAIAGAVSSSISPDFGGVAAVWFPDGTGGYGVVELGKLPGDIKSNATALNDAGDIVGWSHGGMFRRPVLFDLSGAVQDLTATGIFDPRDVNDRRVVVDGSFTAKRLDLTTMIVTDLGVPTGLPQNYLATSAAAINEWNQVCGLAILTSGTNCDRQAARYTDGIGWQIFSGCGQYNGAVDINDRGDVVMQLNLYPYVRFEGLGTFRIEDLIDESSGHWFVINGHGLVINDARQIALPAKNLTTNQTGLVLLNPEGVGTPLCAGDGSAGACPCGNASAAGAGQGCAHSGGHGAVLQASGSAVVAADDLVLRVSQGPPGHLALFLQGMPGSAQPFRDGLLCAGSPVIRLEPVVLDVAGAGASNVSIATKGHVTPGASRVYQAWFRDLHGPCAQGSNLSSALRIDWQ